MTTPKAPIAVAAAAAGLASLEDWGAESIEATLRNMLEETELSARKGFQPLRVAVTGSKPSPPLFESIEVLSRDVSCAGWRPPQPAWGRADLGSGIVL